MFGLVRITKLEFCPTPATLRYHNFSQRAPNATKVYVFEKNSTGSAQKYILSLCCDTCGKSYGALKRYEFEGKLGEIQSSDLMLVFYLFKVP